jgi:hypothetical protein
MTVSIMLARRPYTTPAERVVDKCQLLRDIHEWLGLYFEARTVEEWRTATDESLGGKRVSQYPIEVPANVAHVLNETARKYKSHVGLELPVIITIKGAWRTDETPIAGYVTMSNDFDWRKTYGDIEIGAFAKGEITDVVEVFWKTEQKRQELVSDFMNKFSGYDTATHEMESIIFALGVPTVVGVSEWVASYFKKPPAYFINVLSSMEKDNPTIKTYIRLINRLALASDLYRIEHFKDYLKQTTKRTNVAMDFRLSLQLVGKDLQSYKHLYEELSSSLAQVLRNSLPPDEEIDGKLQKESAKLAGFSTLDSNLQ